MWVVRAENPDPGVPDASLERLEPAVAYAIGKAIGPAVVRNRLRRRLRVLMTELDDADGLPAGQYLVGATPAAVPLGFDELRHHLEGAVHSVNPSGGRSGTAR